MVQSGRLRLCLVSVVPPHVLLSDQALNSGIECRNFKRESDQANDFLDQVIVLNRFLGLESFDDCSINHELSIG